MQHVDNFQRAFRLAFSLHPDREVAACIVEEGYLSSAEVVGQEGKKRTTRENRHAPGFYKVTIPEETAFQLAVYRVSDRWEQSQAGLAPAQRLPYHPTAEDWLVRYIKLLVWKTMEWRAVDVAVGLGCFLYTYTRDHINDLVYWGIPRSLQRSEQWLRTEIGQRFPSLMEHDTVRTRAPRPQDRELVDQALRGLTPWTPEFAPHLAALPSGRSLLATHFAQPALTDAAERGRIHALIDPECAGLTRLINDYNLSTEKGWGEMPFDRPEDKLAIPCWAVTPAPLADTPQPPGDRFDPAPLSARELGRILHSLELQRQRRRAFHAGTLSVYVDGQERAQFDPQGGRRRTFAVPTTASYVEVFGQDADGPLLLAVFEVPEVSPAAPAEERHLVLQYESGQTLGLTIRPHQEHKGATYHFEIAYEEPQRHAVSQPAPSHTLRDHLVHWLSALWSPRFQVDTADAPSDREHTFHYDAGEIKITYKTWTTGPDQPTMLWIAWHADFALAADVWVRFTRPHEREAVLTEVYLGHSVEGERLFRSDRLGFDPTRDPWALALLLKERHA